MSYKIAKTTAFKKLNNLLDKNNKQLFVKFLNDEYEINIETQTILSLSCNVPAKEHIEILILHYLITKVSGKTITLKNEWINFRQLPGGEGYFPTFYKRVIEPIKRKYGNNPESFFNLIQRFDTKKSNFGDFSLELKTFPEIPLLIILWPGWKEFATDANVLFDSSIAAILPTEDIVVLAETVAHLI